MDQTSRPQATSLTGRHLALLFGPLALSSFDQHAFAELRKTLVRSKQHAWVLHTLADLPRLVDAAPAGVNGGASSLAPIRDLANALHTGQPLLTPFPLPNALLVPLTVVSQLIQYASYLERTSTDLGDGIDPFTTPRRNHREAAGLCTGLLSAMAVSCADSREDFQRQGAVAIRLAWLVGAFVDAQDALPENGPSRSFSVAWQSPADEEAMLRMVERSPEVGGARMTPWLCALGRPKEFHSLIGDIGVCFCVL